MEDWWFYFISGFKNCDKMKNLKEYIKDCFEPHNKIAFAINEYKNVLLEYFGEFDKEVCLEEDYILDNLNTHDTEKLKSKILEISKVEFEDYSSDKIKSFSVLCESKEDAISLINNEKFKNLIEFFNYFISEVIDNRIFIEPVYSEDRSKYVFNDCKGICYHITTNERAEKIIKTGLRMKRSYYREFPSRIYLYATPKLSLVNDAHIKDFVYKIVNKLKAEREGGIAIIRVNLNKCYNDVMRFYKDTSMKEDEAIFTYNNIPAECLTKLNKIDFLQ